MIAKLTSSDLEDSITQLESQIETLEDTIEDSDSSDDDYASNVRKYKDLTMKLSTLKTERSNLTVTSKYNGKFLDADLNYQKEKRLVKARVYAKY